MIWCSPIRSENILFFHLCGDNLRHTVSAFAVRMNTIVKHLIAIIGIEGVQVNDLHAKFFGNRLLDGDNLVDNDSVADVPS